MTIVSSLWVTSDEYYDGCKRKFVFYFSNCCDFFFLNNELITDFSSKLDHRPSEQRLKIDSNPNYKYYPNTPTGYRLQFYQNKRYKNKVIKVTQCNHLTWGMWYQGVEWPKMMINNKEKYMINRFEIKFDSIVMIIITQPIPSCCQLNGSEPMDCRLHMFEWTDLKTKSLKWNLI